MNVPSSELPDVQKIKEWSKDKLPVHYDLADLRCEYGTPDPNVLPEEWQLTIEYVNYLHPDLSGSREELNAHHAWANGLIEKIRVEWPACTVRIAFVERRAEWRSAPVLSVDEEEEAKLVYAHFGAAVYRAQCLEHGLVNAMVYLDLIPNHRKTARTKEEWANMVDGFMDQHFEHTLGRMINDLKALTTLSMDLASRLDSALKCRNWLAHDYFRERAEVWLQPEGRRSMIAELKQAEAEFKEVDRLLHTALKPIRERYGFTDARIKHFFDELLLQNSEH